MKIQKFVPGKKKGFAGLRRAKRKKLSKATTKGKGIFPAPRKSQGKKLYRCSATSTAEEQVEALDWIPGTRMEVIALGHQKLSAGTIRTYRSPSRGGGASARELLWFRGVGRRKGLQGEVCSREAPHTGGSRSISA